ncbi:MAG: amidohydrolase family protein [Firmicutes bacterium]|nr:amidohydrolase family protein [Bacillota bacterium]
MSRMQPVPEVEETVAATAAVDHHAHAFRRGARPVAEGTFRRLFSESDFDETLERHVPHQTAYRWGVRRLWSFWDLPGEPPAAPGEAEAALRERLAGIPFADYARMLLEGARLRTLVLDTGFLPEQYLGVEEMAGLAPCEVREVLRLERAAAELLSGASSAADLREALQDRIRRAAAGPQGIVGLKSVIAYRSGLAVEPPPRAEAEAAFRRTKEAAAAAGGGAPRLVEKALLDDLLWGALEEAARLELPVQFHVGHGDRDTDLRLGNPLHLRRILEEPAFRRVPIVLLHNYPYVAEAAYLAHIYPNVFADLSLAIPQAGALAAGLVHEFLGLAPATKLLYASDAHSLPEFHYLGSLLYRRALVEALSRLVQEDFLSPAEAAATARDVLAGNALRVYGRLSPRGGGAD